MIKEHQYSVSISRHWQIMLAFFLLCYASNAQYFHNYADHEVSIMLTIMLKHMASEHAQ